MKRPSVLCQVRSLMILAVMLGASAHTDAGQEESVSGEYTFGRVVSMTTVSPGDRAGHDLVQLVRVDDRMSSSNPDFDGAVCVLFAQADNAPDGDSPDRGHSNCLHRGGDRSYFSYVGRYRVITKDDKSWEVPLEGTFQFTGGTGKFRSLKGTGTYKGVNLPAGGKSTWEARVEY